MKNKLQTFLAEIQDCNCVKKRKIMRRSNFEEPLKFQHNYGEEIIRSGLNSNSSDLP